MFGIVIVPWHIVMVKKGEEPIPILIDPLLQRGADLGRALQGRHVIQKPFGGPLMFPEMSFLQAICIDGRDNLPKQRSESVGNEGQFFIERVFQNVLIYVAHQVDQTLLLPTRHAVVSAVKIARVPPP
jgi:hypothetical protein